MLVVVLLGPAGGNCQAASTKSHGGIFFFFSNLHYLFYVPCVFFLFLIPLAEKKGHILFSAAGAGCFGFCKPAPAGAVAGLGPFVFFLYPHKTFKK